MKHKTLYSVVEVKDISLERIAAAHAGQSCVVGCVTH